MSRKLNLQNLKKYSSLTHEGASAYDYSASHPLIHLTFTLGAALFVGGYYQRQEEEVRRLAGALLAAHRCEPPFPWQYGAWVRDPVDGKGNRIQGTLVPALLDGLLDPDNNTEKYVTLCLQHRADDVIAFFEHYERLGLGRPSPQARRGMARALAGFDEYQLLKYAAQKEDTRLCDVIYVVRDELRALGTQGRLALAVGEYLHAPGRHRSERCAELPLTRARRRIFRRPKGALLAENLAREVAKARLTWEQLFSHFGRSTKNLSGAELSQAQRHNASLWQLLLEVPGLLPDLALLRNVRNMHQAGLSTKDLRSLLQQRKFTKVWPHQIYAAFRSNPELESVWQVAFAKTIERLPPGRHLGIGDASASMSVPVGGPYSSIRSMDVAFCLVALMSETSGLGASFSDNSWMSWLNQRYLSLGQRRPNEGPLSFSLRPDIRAGMGGTQVFGAVLELIAWLKSHDHVKPPDALWFFSDMQFHPAEGSLPQVPDSLLAQARKLGLDQKASANGPAHTGLGQSMPPLELALRLYRDLFGRVDVILWNLAAYAPVPVPAEMPGVLLVSGFDANTFELVRRWREGGDLSQQSVEQSQEEILNKIRSY